MAGALYLGQEKLDSVILEEEPLGVSLYLPDEVTTLSEENLYIWDGRFEDLNVNISADLNNVEEILDYGLKYYFCRCNKGKVLRANKIRLVNGIEAMRGAFSYSNFTNFNFNFSSIESVMGNYGLREAFEGTFNLPKEIHFSNLVNLTGSYALACCFGDKDVTIRGRSPTTDIYFESLNSNSFGQNTNQFYNMLNWSKKITVHFPSNLVDILSNWNDIKKGCGGINTTVLFDLPATE